MLLTNKKGEERNYGVLIAAIVAIVAIVGLIILFTKGGASGAAVDVSDTDAVADAVAQSMDAGARCGQCAADLTRTGVWDSSKCPALDQSGVSGYTPNKAMQYCCSAECETLNGWKHCQRYCRNAATQAGYGYSAGTGGWSQ